MDAKYLFNTEQYYKRQLSELVNNDYIKKHKSGCYILSDTGKRYLKSFDYDFSSKMAYSEKYIQRQIVISFIASFYKLSKNVKFVPSFKHKDKDVFTIKSRRYIGLIRINKKEYLTYYIEKNQNSKYINSVFFDIQKEQQYKNIIIFIDDISKINLDQFSFGLKEVLIIETNESNLKNLNYINKINIPNIIRHMYGTKAFISEYNFCDYTDKKDKYIAFFYFIDTEKINLIRYFLKENKDKKIDFVSNNKNIELLKEEIPNQNYITIDFDDYIVKGEFKTYE